MKEIDKFVDLSGVELKLGDFVAFYHGRYKTRVGRVCGFTGNILIGITMRKMMMMALMAVGMTAFASEKNDTTIIENAYKVMVITGDSVQTVMVNGKEGSRDYRYVNSIKITDPNVKKCKLENDSENNGLDFDFGVMSEQIDHVRLDRSKLAKIYNQDCNVKETWKNVKSIQG